MKKVMGVGSAVALILLLVLTGRAEEVELPKQLAQVVPAYRAAKVVSSMHMGNNWHGVLETSDSPQQAVAFYKEALTGKGWGVFMEIQQANTAALGLRRDDYRLMVGAEASDGKTSVSLSLIEGEG